MTTLVSNGVPGMTDAAFTSQNEVQVTTRDKTGALANHPFYISVLCNSKAAYNG